MPQICDMGQDGFYFPSEGRRAEVFFFALENPTSSAEFEPTNLGSKGQHATSRPPKPLVLLLVRNQLKLFSKTKCEHGCYALLTPRYLDQNTGP
jgi:hypothetical protein